MIKNALNHKIPQNSFKAYLQYKQYKYSCVSTYEIFIYLKALAAEDLETELRGLPETKHTKYLEMGRHEMEVCI